MPHAITSSVGDCGRSTAQLAHTDAIKGAHGRKQKRLVLLDDIDFTHQTRRHLEREP